MLIEDLRRKLRYTYIFFRYLYILKASAESKVSRKTFRRHTVTLWPSTWPHVTWMWSHFDMNVKTLCPFFSLSVTTCCGHFVKSQWDFNVEFKHLWRLCTEPIDQILPETVPYSSSTLFVFYRFVTTLHRVRWPDFTRFQSGKIGQAFV